MPTAVKVSLGVIVVAFVAMLLIGSPGNRSSAGQAPADASTVNPGASETRSYPAMDRDDKHAIFDAHTLVEAQLRDPDSAVFDDQRSWLEPPNVLVRRIAGTPVIVCGWVNAKNGYGGMTGDEAYIVDLRNSSAVIEANAEQVRALCAS